MDLERQLAEVNESIQGVETQIADIEALLKTAPPEDKQYLREKEKQLREEKKQLREKELFFLRRLDGAEASSNELKEIKEVLTKVSEQTVSMDASMKEMDASMKEMDASIKETDASMKDALKNVDTALRYTTSVAQAALLAATTDNRSQSSRGSNTHRDAAQFYGAQLSEADGAPKSVIVSSCKAENRLYNFCAASGLWFPKEFVKAAHIAPATSKINAYLGLWGIDAACKKHNRNMILLHQSIEKAFDEHRLTFFPRGGVHFEVRVLDPSLLHETVATMDDNRILKFESIDRQDLQFLNDERPYKRCCLFRACLAFVNAQLRGWVARDEFPWTSLKGVPQPPEWECDKEQLERFLTDCVSTINSRLTFEDQDIEQLINVQQLNASDPTDTASELASCCDTSDNE